MTVHVEQKNPFESPRPEGVASVTSFPPLPAIPACSPCPQCGRAGSSIKIGDATFCAACGYTSDGISGCT
jgi:hypothetical protein